MIQWAVTHYSPLAVLVPLQEALAKLTTNGLVFFDMSFIRSVKQLKASYLK